MDVVNAFKDMDNWFETLAGKYLLQEICRSFLTIPFISNTDSMLQIGSCGGNPWLKQIRYNQSFILTPSIGPQSDLVALPNQLPFMKESFQLIFLPFLFDLVKEDILTIVNEVDRILESMGYITILGMNPSGLWKLSRFFKSKKNLWWYQMTSGNSYWKLTSLFKSLGYEQIDAQFFYYTPPIQSKTALNYFAWVNRMSKLIAFYPPAFFLLTLQKKQPSLILPNLVKSTFW
jgi:hypothetical protein